MAEMKADSMAMMILKVECLAASWAPLWLWGTCLAGQMVLLK